jgi:hypothetical protein
MRSFERVSGRRAGPPINKGVEGPAGDWGSEELEAGELRGEEAVVEERRGEKLAGREWGIEKSSAADM